MTDAPNWDWYWNALEGKFGPIHTTPEQGYFRVRESGGRGQWEPVAIWFADGQWKALRNGSTVPADKIEGLWISACRYPITEEAYQQARGGGGFSDEPARAVMPGDNITGGDPLEAIRIEFLGEKEQVEEFLKRGIKADEDADKLSIWKDRILKLRGRAQALFKAEKQPIVDEGRRIDEKYRALAHEKESEPTALLERIRVALEAHLKKKRDEEAERQRAARAEAERIRREAEEAERAAAKAAEEAAAMAEEGAAGEVDEDALFQAQQEAARLAEAAAQAEKEAEARKVSAGRTGARTSLRKIKKGRVLDYEKAALALVRMPHRDMMDLIDRLANGAATGRNEPFDGMEIYEEEVAR